MEKKKATLIWHFIFAITIFVLIVSTLLNLELVSECTLHPHLDCKMYRTKLMIYAPSLAFVIIFYVFYLRRVVPSVPQRKLASTRVKKAKLRDSENLEKNKDEENS
ncbi:MAG: hypothetical protein ACTSRE_02305 [Promethearchaeota archaeon]